MKFLLQAGLLLGFLSTPTVAQVLEIGDDLKLEFDVNGPDSMEFFFKTDEGCFELVCSNIYEQDGDTVSNSEDLADLTWAVAGYDLEGADGIELNVVGASTAGRFSTIRLFSILSASSLKFDLAISGYSTDITGDLRIDCDFKCDEDTDDPGLCNELVEIDDGNEVEIEGTDMAFSIVTSADGDTDEDGTNDEVVTVSLASSGNTISLIYSGFSGGNLFHDPTVEQKQRGGGGAACFSPDATAVVQGKGKTAMKDIAVGDMVLTGSGQYSSVYTIDHHHATRPTKYLQIDTSMEGENPLEVTPSHMLFIQGDSNPVPASNIKVGDAVKTLDGYQDVVEIKTVFRNGLYNPITPDGTIVADGVVASTYHAFSADDKNVIIGEWKTPVSHQTFMHMALAPLRTFCMGVSSSLCETDEEYNVYSKFGTHLLDFTLKQNIYVQRVMFSCILLFFALTSCVPILVGVYCLFKFSGKMIKS